MVCKKTIMTIGTIFLLTTFSISIFLPIFINYQSKTIKNDDKTNINNFFKKDEIDQSSSKISIIKNINKYTVLNKLTNYNDVYDISDLVFDMKKIKVNLLKIIKEEIKEKCNIKYDSLYLQLRYSISGDDELYIDARWVDKNNYLLTYYDKNVIKLNNNIEVKNE